MTTKAITPLCQRMIEDMNARKLGAHSQRSHIYSCKRLAGFLKRSPETATCEDLRLFQLHLAETGMSIFDGAQKVIRIEQSKGRKDRILPRPRASVAFCQCRSRQPRPVEGDVGHRALPHVGARRACRAL